MEQITFIDVAQSMVSELEALLSKIALASQSNISTYNLESSATKLARKIKESAKIFGDLPIYRGTTKQNKIWRPTDEFTADELSRYAKLCKASSEELDVYKVENEYYINIQSNIFIRLYDIPPEPMPKFKVKLEGNTLMAVRSDIAGQLPDAVKKVLQIKEGEE